MSFINCWTICSSYDFQAHQHRSQRRCCFSQSSHLWFEVLPDMSAALPDLPAAIPNIPRLVVSAPRLLASDPSFSEGWQECPRRVRYSPEIDASSFTCHIPWYPPGGFQRLKYILLMTAFPVLRHAKTLLWPFWPFSRPGTCRTVPAVPDLLALP